MNEVFFKFSSTFDKLLDEQQKSVEAVVTLCSALVAQAYLFTYSQLSLSRLRLSRITAFLEMKIWSLF